jgi:nucleoid DNA-binding protein
MKKADLVSELRKASGATTEQVELMLDHLEVTIEKAMLAKDKLTFGHLILEGVTKPAKSGMNPLTKKPYNNPAYNGAEVKFAPSFKAKLKNS